MSKTVTIGGNRLGSGKKMETTMHGYERSNHDLSFLWKSTMAPGTLVPFMSIPALPGDTFDIDLNSIVKTAPTIGPLFGSFKLQLDVFTCPIRLYNKLLHNNALGIGLEIDKVKLPQLHLTGVDIDPNSETPVTFQQINQSSLLAYLGIRGIGYSQTQGDGTLYRRFNAVPYLAYWDIFKNYYANKQEVDAYVIVPDIPSLTQVVINNSALPRILTGNDVIKATGTSLNIGNVELYISDAGIYQGWWKIGTIGKPDNWPFINNEGEEVIINGIKTDFIGLTVTQSRISPDPDLSNTKPKLVPFAIKNIDNMRNSILSANETVPFVIDANTPEVPYGLPLQKINTTEKMVSMMGQCGLAVKTYQSDVFNNWIQTEWIEGNNSIAEITKISTAGDSFTIDTLNLSKKVYNMLNRIAISGGSYEDWISAVYDNESRWRAETPVYQGGLSKEIIFTEVISNAATKDDPLGTLAGKGIMADKHKGGHLVINCDEPSYIIEIVSITPRICYSQGNQWDTNLQTLDDLHKPALDGIGFQDLITDQMLFADTWTSAPVTSDSYPIFKSAGKQPAWLNYQTNHDKSYGNFADERSQQFMTLDRKYKLDENGIVDLTTYIDPSKFNYAFAQTDLSAQNFWTQIAVNINARRKMSAKIIPNL